MDKIYERLMDDDSIVLETPECNEGVAYFSIDNVKYSCYWSEDWGVDEGSIEIEVD